MADIVAKIIQNNTIQTRFGDQNQPQVAKTILNNPNSNIYFSNLADIDASGLKDKSVPVYDSISGKFKLNQANYDITDGGNF